MSLEFGFPVNPDYIQVTTVNGQRKETLMTTWKGPYKSLFIVYAPWCHFCKELKPVIDQVKKQRNCMVYSVNGDANKKVMSKLNIGGFPSIYIVERDGSLTPYLGPRNVNSIISQL